MMSPADWGGSFGVALLLVAFFGNTIGRLPASSRLYHGLNAVGAAVAAWASWRIGFLPFVVLEGVWCLVAVVALTRLAGAPRAGR
jgi:hypothetical protein